jgi:LysM repeat protein
MIVVRNFKLIEIIASPMDFQGDRIMKWKDSNNIGRLEDDPEGDFLEDEDYPVWQKPKKGLLGDNLFKTLKFPVVIIGVGFLVLIVFSVVFISDRDTPNVDHQVALIEKRLRQIENRLNDLELNSGAGKRIEEQNSKLVEVEAKISRIEASVALRMDQIASEINRLQKRMSASRSSSAGAGSATPSKPSQSSLNVKYHQVRAGETLYGIGKRYGLNAEALIKLNNIKPGAVIYPGQKLVVKK